MLATTVFSGQTGAHKNRKKVITSHSSRKAIEKSGATKINSMLDRSPATNIQMSRKIFESGKSKVNMTILEHQIQRNSSLLCIVTVKKQKQL